MKKLSLMLVFVALFAVLFAFSAFAGSFVRGEENTVITSDDIAVGADGNKMYEIIAGETKHGKPSDVLDGVGTAYWGGPTGTKLKVTFTNEWEITDVKAYLLSNWAHIEFQFYAADDTLLGSKGFYGLGCNSSNHYLYGGDLFDGGATVTDVNGAVMNITYGDENKAVKYMVIYNYGDKWGYLPGVAEVVLTGRERIPTVGCDKHEFETVIISEATCTESGSSANVCKKCGAQEAVVTIPALGHKIGEYTIKTPATCISAPVIEFVCANGCGETLERDVHVDNIIEYCDKNTIVTYPNGSGGGTMAPEMFDGSLDTSVIASAYWAVDGSIAFDMNYYISSVTVWVGNRYDASSSNSAWLTVYYQVPGETEWQVAGRMQTPADYDYKKHEYTLEFETPVYASAVRIFVGDKDGAPKGWSGLQSHGGLVYEAKVTGSIVEDTAAGHTWVAGDVTAPTCFEAGYTTYTCSVCSATKKSDFVRETGEHSYTVVDNTEEKNNEGKVTWSAKEPTCTEAGEYKYRCETCRYTEKRKVDALGHDMQDATCLAPSTCSRCGLTEGEVGDHVNSFAEIYEYVSATCKTDGYEKDICAVCNEEYTVVFPADPEFGHREIWGTGVGKDATCQADGYYSYQCEICNETITTVLPVDEYAHVWDETLAVSVPATCVAGGYSYNKCSLCGTEVTEEFEANDWSHDYNGVASNGVIVYTCTLCGDSYEEELPTALPYGDTTAEIVAGEYGWTESVNYSVSVPGNYVLTIKNEAEVYVVYSDGDEIIPTSTFAFTLAEGESITFAVITSDRAAGKVELNLASADNAALNGTYVSADGKAMFVFADGVLTVTDTNEMMPSGFAGTYTYNYNSVTGEIAVNPSTLTLSAGLDMGGNTQILVFGRIPLSVYVPPMDAVLGDNEITVTNTNYFFDGIKVVFTATEAGTYVITASETGIVIVEDMYGSEVVKLPYEVELAEGQAFEFIVSSSANPMMGENDTVVVNIAKKVTHVHVEVEIPAILPTPSVQGYTAGVKCSECDATLVEPKAIEVTELEFADTTLRYNGISLSAKENISLIYRAIGAKNFKSAYAVFVIEGKEYLVDEYVVEGDGRYKFNFKETRPQLMNSNVEAYIYGENADGSYTMNKNTDYSVKKYIVGQLKKNDPALTTAMSDILYMGAMTQLYMGVNTNALITDIVEAEGYTLTPSAFTSISKDLDIQAVTGDRTTGTDWKGISLAFGATTEVVFKFETDNVEGLKVKVNIAGADKYYDVKELTKDENGRYVVYFDGAKSFEYNEVITATFERDGVQVGSTFTYSINTFLARNYQNTNYSESARNLMKAIYTYGESLAAYFN